GFYSVRATKAYRRFGQFPITVYVTDRFLRIAIAHGTATVLDAPVSVWGGKLIGRVGRPVRGRVAIITDDNQLAHRTDFRTTISWGDGRSSAGRLVRLAPGRFAVIGRHDYGKPGRFVARVRVHEAGLSELQTRTTVDIRDR